MGRETREVWKKRVAALHRSGKSIRAFAEEIGVNHNTLTGWKVRLARETNAAQTRSQRGRSVVQKSGPRFVEVTSMLAQESSRSSEPEGFELTLSNGMAIRVPPRFEKRGLSELLDVVEGR